MHSIKKFIKFLVDSCYRPNNTIEPRQIKLTGDLMKHILVPSGTTRLTIWEKK